MLRNVKDFVCYDNFASRIYHLLPFYSLLEYVVTWHIVSSKVHPPPLCPPQKNFGYIYKKNC